MDKYKGIEEKTDDVNKGSAVVVNPDRPPPPPKLEPQKSSPEESGSKDDK